ncbi:MAG: LPS-assembly protein [Pseudohongiellaceae bacterium]|jgi:LPS-assembly protein
MLFKKHYLSTEIALILSAGVFLGLNPGTAQAQLPQYNCRPNAQNDGWVCAVPDGTSALPSINASQRYRPSSEPNVFVPAPALESEPETEAGRREVEPTNSRASTTVAGTSSNVEDPQSLISAKQYPLDWVPRAELSSAQIAALPANCCGAFIDPSLVLKTPENDPALAPTTFNAVSGLTQFSDSLYDIEGDVTVAQGYRTVQNDRSTKVNREENTILMQGNVEFREPGMLILGQSAFIDTDNSSNRIETAQYVIHDFSAHGTAANITYNSDTGFVVIENGEFSRCEPEDPFWKLSASSIVLDQTEGRGYATKVSLRVKDVPLFYYPFTMPFPLGEQRSSGFLAPSTGSTRSGGFDFELPYYFNLAPNYDATFSPRILSDRGVMATAEFRYLAESSMNTLNMSHLAGDQLFDANTADILGSLSPPTENRWFLGYKHQGVFGEHWSTFVDYNAVSDEDYFFDLGNNGLNVFSRSHLNRQGRINFNSEYLRAGINVQRVQVIDPFINTVNINTPYDILPQLHFETEKSLPLGFAARLRGEFTSFDRSLDEAVLSPALVNNGALVTGERINLEPEISWSAETPGWFVRANAKYKYAQYQLENQALATMENPDIGVGIFNVDAGLVFERTLAKGSITQTLEPRIYYLYSEFEDQSMLPLFDTAELNFSFNQLFRDDRFSGGDRIADANQVTAALTSKILDKNGKERARASIGQITYFEDRQVSLRNPLINFVPRYSPLSSTSSLIGEFALSAGQNWQLNTDVQWNQEAKDVDEGSVQLRYQRDNSHIFNLSYRIRNLVDTPTFLLPLGISPQIKQTDVSGVWPLSPNWKVLGRWNYDHSNARNIDAFAGVEWSNCCATIRVIGREWVDQDELFVPNVEPNQAIFVQFTLNGLGNLTGGGLTNLLSDGIWGFRDTEYE